MIISLRWLNDFVDVKDYLSKPEALAEILTRAGLEVENITNRAKDFDHVVVGLILEKAKHPNADKLSLCRISTGEGVVHQIVCGAQNHKTNDRVIVALPGAILPGNFAIKQSSIRGVESGGMLCSDKELGLAKESEGLRILPEDAPIGKPFSEYAGLDDVTFELKVTPNRADCLSHFGLAREVACLLGRPLKNVAPQLKLSSNSTRSEIQLEVREPELCPRYAGRFMAQVKVGPSPAWLQKRLESVGLSSINNIVDVTNYVMMELGQPLHAFDAAEIKGNKIIVEKAKPQEKFQTLDGTELTLTGEELMIRDESRAVAMAGVVGGKNSGVNDSTTSLFLEAAYFLPMIVRQASRAHGINTDSGYRFSRGVDPSNTVRSLDRAVELILQVAGGMAYDEHYDFYPHPVKKKPVTITLKTVSERLGYAADKVKFVDFMQRLGCLVENTSDNFSKTETQSDSTFDAQIEFQVLPPTFRFDIAEEIDLVEEYARLNGYEYIPDAIPLTSVEPAAHDKMFLLQNQTSSFLASQGLYQALNFAFTSEKSEKDFIGSKSTLNDLGLPMTEKAIRLMNPISDDLNVMRSSLGFGLFRNMSYNYHQGNDVGGLFEVGKTFSFSSENASVNPLTPFPISAASSVMSQYLEHQRLGLIQWGHHSHLWAQKPEHPLIFELKAKIENMLARFKLKSYQWLQEDQVPNFLHRGQWAILQVEGKKVGYLGALHPRLVDENKIRGTVVLAEFNLDLLLAGQPRLDRFVSVSKLPVVQRDLALQMAQNIAAGDVSREIKKLAGPLLLSVEIFDLYEGDKLPKGLKSVAYRLRLQDKNATLQDEAVNKLMETVIAGLIKKFSLSLR